MPEPDQPTAPVEDRVRRELQRIRENVTGVHGSLTATSDGLLIAHDLADMEPTRIAALVATSLALGSRMTLSTGRGDRMRRASSGGTAASLERSARRSSRTGTSRGWLLASMPPNKVSASSVGMAATP